MKGQAKPKATMKECWATDKFGEFAWSEEMFSEEAANFLFNFNGLVDDNTERNER